ncbi:Acyl-CoA hydrolase [Desulfatibacillum alkenivorans DSM 16219]|jgi:acyl-CoA hydrolase/GNAT superfamily N-acetyltransferase|uniref:Acyl-CoA hydrolase n=1 Tax=Desulfatibacillum alkenivorans DSM 16219 TaxID=1121393 RepID=A0A1M6QQ33_9BACT|nr:bifunctional acetyl-CoA hydrolase/transferase family protein/GNAT family N-acetyltransferase [Desulfatibacillum alkenivorans]SHK22248.1 Acyl-CoA hydrolase [Desulfatibacillum alkenivorans DSM 16219]
MMDHFKWLTEQNYQRKVVSPAEAVSHIKRGSRVFIGTGCGEPQALIHAMVADPSIQDVSIHQMLSLTLSLYVDDPSFLRRFSVKAFFVSESMRKATYEGKIDYVPAYLSQIPRLFESQRLGIDVALIQVSPPDRYGYCSLGVSVDVTRSGAKNAHMVIAQINHQMPRTWGDCFIHVNDIDYMVLQDEPLVNWGANIKDSEVARRIGMYVSQLVEDGATLQIGFGRLPNAILSHLKDKKDLGIHTQVITDAFLPLIERGAITNRKKNYLPDKIVASLCMGSEKLYRQVDNNPLFYFRGSEFVNDPVVIARNDNLVSISSALEVDLTGQVCSDSAGRIFYSGIGDQVDFLRGSAMSNGGFSIVALPSTAKGGKVSRIVPQLSEGAGVATTRGDVNFVVTEYGIAELQGQSIYQRVMELAQIAHPKFRKELIEMAKERRYIFADQLPPPEDDLLFLEQYKSSRLLPNGKVVEFRPLLPSDEIDYRNFFYSLKEETIYYRFFHNKKTFSHEVVQKQWAAVDYRKNMSIIGLGPKGGYKEIIAIGSYAESENGFAEVAFVTSESYQKQGIASYIIEVLERIARENGYKGFVATVIRDNIPMLRVFEKRYPNLKSCFDGGEITLEMPFAHAEEKAEASQEGNK